LIPPFFVVTFLMACRLVFQAGVGFVVQISVPIMKEFHVSGGVFVGTADSVIYWTAAPEQIKDDPTPLTEFSDGVYHTIQLLAMRELTVNEQADNADRFKFIGETFGTMLSSLGPLSSGGSSQGRQ